MKDPVLEAQATMVARLTEDRVAWTLTHREVLIALRDGSVPAEVPRPIIDDVEDFLRAALDQLEGPGCGVRRPETSRENVRTEFGFKRLVCDCDRCQRNCRFMPGFLVPADLERLLPTDQGPFEWAEDYLLASPGALVMKHGTAFRVRTLVSAVKKDRTCIHLQGGRCGIHEKAPYGCALFDCKHDGEEEARAGITAVWQAWQDEGLYAQLWQHLHRKNKRQLAPERLRAMMSDAFRDSMTTEQCEFMQRCRKLGDVTRTGVMFAWELAGSSGASFELFRELRHTDADIDAAKQQLLDERDAVQLSVTDLGDNLPG